MLKNLLLVLFLLIGSYVHSQNEVKEIEVRNTIETFFEGFHKADTAIINKTIHKDLKIQTSFINAKGESILKTNLKEDFLKSIATKNSTDIWLEKLRTITIKIDQDMASVWTPYEFYFNNKFSHCGVNSFQLFNNNGNWEIIYLIDTRRKQGCEFKE